MDHILKLLRIKIETSPLVSLMLWFWFCFAVAVWCDLLLLWIVSIIFCFWFLIVNSFGLSMGRAKVRSTF